MERGNPKYDSRNNCNAIIETKTNTLISGCKTSVIPSNVVAIGNHAFGGCTGLTSLVIPNNVTTIGECAFQGCTGLTSITIPNSVTTIGGDAFNSCTGLMSITLGNSVTSIGWGAFSKCTGLTGITIPESVTSIGGMAFFDCKSLKSIILGGNIREWGNNVFASPWIDYYTYCGCPDLKIYTKPGSVTLLTLWSVDNYYNQIYYYFGGTTINKYVVDYIYDSKYINEQQKLNPFFKTTASSLHIMEYDDVDIVSRTTGNYNETMCGGHNPNTEFDLGDVSITYKNSNGKSTTISRRNYSCKTNELLLTTQQPRVVSSGNVVVSAISNLDDNEVNVGFEWRRTDWTSDFESNKGGAYLFDGMMEGYIRNLNADKLWKYRPYYTSNSGQTYYGDWVGIDPTNTSYFEPTVHTYAKISVEGNAAEVKGYVMRGSDNVVQQGFKYWKASTATTREGEKHAPSIPKDAMTVEAEGTVMTAELTDLEYETEYCIVAFVKTSENETFYGEQQTFRIGIDTSGVEETVAAPSEITEVVRYDLNGRRLDAPRKGLNIFRMSDGTVRKVMVK